MLTQGSDLGRRPGDGYTTDPTGSYTRDTNSILSGLVTRSLTQYVYDSASGSMVLVPDIATDLGTPNGDFTQWTFTIRDGVRFEDGRTVSADDIALGIKRSFDRTDFGGGPTQSNDYFVDGHRYQGPYISGTDYQGVTVDGNTLTIKMARPFPDMPYWAAFPAMGPIPERGSDPATYWRHPMATGPYKFDTYVPGKSLTLVRNDEWDPNTDPGRHAYPDRYVFKFNQDPREIERDILGDSTQPQTALSYDGISAATAAKARRRDQLTPGLGLCEKMLMPDNRKITDIKVRKALGYAFPYRAWAAFNGEVFGRTALPGSSILPPATPGRLDYTVLDAAPGQTKPHKARMLLRQAGYAPGDYTITFAYIEGTGSKGLLVKSLHAAGFATDPIGMSSNEYAQVQLDPHSPFNVRFLGWCPDWSSGGQWFPQLIASDGDFNLAHFKEPSEDASIAAIARLPLNQQPSAWGRFDEQLMTRYYPGFPIYYFGGGAILHGAHIGSVNVDSVLGMPTWKDLYVRR